MVELILASTRKQVQKWRAIYDDMCSDRRQMHARTGRKQVPAVVERERCESQSQKIACRCLDSTRSSPSSGSENGYMRGTIYFWDVRLKE